LVYHRLRMPPFIFHSLRVCASSLRFVSPVRSSSSRAVPLGIRFHVPKKLADKMGLLEQRPVPVCNFKFPFYASACSKFRQLSAFLRHAELALTFCFHPSTFCQMSPFQQEHPRPARACLRSTVVSFNSSLLSYVGYALVA
jgi:hypothetical protein